MAKRCVLLSLVTAVFLVGSKLTVSHSSARATFRIGCLAMVTAPTISPLNVCVPVK